MELENDITALDLLPIWNAPSIPRLRS